MVLARTQHISLPRFGQATLKGSVSLVAFILTYILIGSLGLLAFSQWTFT